MPTETPTMPSLRPLEPMQFQNFPRTLRAAIHDKREESSRQPVVLFDADVVVGATYPVEGILRTLADEEVAEPRATPRAGAARDRVQNLVRALWASGYLGEARMLRPHITELAEVTRSKQVMPAAELRQVLEGRGLAAALRRLTEITNALERHPDEVGRVLYNLAPHLRYQTFTLMDAALFDTWERRRAQIGRHLSLVADIGPSVKQLIRQSACIVLARRIWERRPEVLDDQGHPVNSDSTLDRSSLVDAAALLLLFSMTERSKASASGRVVRFYSQTSALYDAVASIADDDPDPLPRLRDSLGVVDDQGGTLRSDGYMLLRATFPALRFPGLEDDQSHHWPEAASLEDLEELAGRVGNVLDNSEAGRSADEAALPRVREFVEQRVFLTFCQSVWFDQRERALRLFGKTFEEARQLIKVVSANEGEIQAVLNEKAYELAQEADELRLASKRYDEAIRVARGLSLYIPAKARDEDTLLRVSGAGRWVAGLSPAGLNRLRSMLGDLLSSSDKRRDRAFAAAVEGLGSGKADEAMHLAAAAMSCVNQWELIVRSLREAEWPRDYAGHVTVIQLEAVGRIIMNGRRPIPRLGLDSVAIKRRIDACWSQLPTDGEAAGSATIAVAWLTYYWCHYWAYIGGGQIIRALDDDDPSQSTGRGLAERALRRLDGIEDRHPAAWARGLGDVVTILLEPYTMVEEALQVPEHIPRVSPPEDNIYWSDASIWREAVIWSVEKKRRAPEAAAFYAVWLGSALSELKRADRCSREDYWEHHLRFMELLKKEL